MKTFARILSLSLLILSPLVAGDWPLHRGNAAATGNNDDIPPQGNKLYFSLTADSAIHSLAVSEGSLYFTTESGWAYAVDEETGDLRFKRRLAAGRAVPMRLAGMRMVLPHSNGLISVQRVRGAVQWAHGTEFPAGFEQVVLGARIAVARGPRQVIGLSLQDGKRIWATDIPGDPAGPLVLVGDEIYLSSVFGGKTTLYRLTRDLGAVTYTTEIEGTNAPFPLVGRERVHMVSGNGWMALSREKGTIEVKETLPAPSLGPLFQTESAITIPLQGGKIAQIDPRAGKLKRTLSVPGLSNIAAAVLIRDTLFVLDVGDPEGPRHGKIIGVDLISGLVNFTFEHQKGGVSGDLIASSGRLLMALDNDLMSVGPDGQVWFGADRHGNFTQEPPPRNISLTNVLTDVRTNIVAVRFITNAKNQPRERAYDFYGKTFEEPKVTRIPGSTNVVTTVTTNVERHSVPAELAVFPPKPRPPLPTVTLKLTVKDGAGAPVAARVEVITRDGGRILERKVVEPGEPFAELTLPKPGNTELLVGLEGYMDNKAEIAGAEKIQAVERTLVLTKIETGKSIVVENIRFEFNKATLLPESVTILDRVRETLMRSSNLQVEVRGFTDNIGGIDENKALSLKRAQSVREYLVKNGIPGDRLTATGMGPVSPIADNNTEGGRSRNRRTEFFIVKY